jgi:hypothetical protein
MDGVILSVRATLLMAFRTLPIILISFIAFLAAGLGNLGLFVLFIGQSVLIPIVTTIVHALVTKVAGTNDNRFFINSSEKALLIPGSVYSSPRMNVAPSYWMVHVHFLLAYLFTNAAAVNALPEDSTIDPILLANRKSKSKTIMISTIFIALALSILKYKTNTETIYGIGIAFGLGSILGYAWYNFAASCGARAADVFGIVQQVVPSSAKNDKPMTCVYAPKP